MKICSIAYLPPKSVTTAGHVESFRRNLERFTHAFPVHFYSYEYRDEKDVIPLQADVMAGQSIKYMDGGKLVEITEPNKVRNTRVNLIFWTGVVIASSIGYTHMICLETDCRFGCDNWDDIMVKEWLAKGGNAIAAGSMAIFNPSAHSRECAERFERFVMETKPTRPCPLSITGNSHLGVKQNSCVFPNGALAIYDLRWLLKTYPALTSQKPNDIVKFCTETVAWDYQIGIDLWKEFNVEVYDRVCQLDCIYSGYMDVMSTEDERKKWLTDGKIVAVHQVKSGWDGPDKSNGFHFPEDENQSFPNVNGEALGIRLKNFRVELESSNESIGKTKLLEKENWTTSTGALVLKQQIEQNVSVLPSCDIFIITYAKDFPYLKHCLRSIAKFAVGFKDVVILVPNQDVKSLREVIVSTPDVSKDIRVKGGYEWKEKGMLWHMAQLCHAEKWCTAEYICHMDADCIFTGPVSPLTFFTDGKPNLRYEPFETLCKRHPGVWNWKIAADNALPFTVANEYMRGHCHVYHRSLYERTREVVEKKTGMLFNEYVKSGKNDYPQQFCEHVTLGAVAHHEFVNDYYLIDLSKVNNPDKNPYPILQTWSHGKIDDPQDLMIDGVATTLVPLEKFNAILGCA